MKKFIISLFLALFIQSIYANTTLSLDMNLKMTMVENNGWWEAIDTIVDGNMKIKSLYGSKRITKVQPIDQVL